MSSTYSKRSRQPSAPNFAGGTAAAQPEGTLHETIDFYMSVDPTQCYVKFDSPLAAPERIAVWCSTAGANFVHRTLSVHADPDDPSRLIGDEWLAVTPDVGAVYFVDWTALIPRAAFYDRGIPGRVSGVMQDE
jgi:hypothetical protein